MIRSAWVVPHRRRNADATPRTPIERLAWSFPTLRGAPGVVPWDPEELDRWACGPVPSSGGLYAAQFVLGVWNIFAEWGCGRFDALRALNTWDSAHREAFVEWAEDPWTA
ncbi:MAG: hypothetical protein KIT58_05260 [Planctomycetota bacterium]|nr:hypothetical protein [Planctomycetota bacterium]